MIEDTLGTYPAASSYTRLATHDSLVLQTATGLTPHGLVTHPLFFSGNLSRPDVAAAGLRALVEIVGTRYYKPVPDVVWKDPVVTANGDRLRCEVFSACNGVYARLDLLAETFNGAVLGFGTTNVDINPPLAQALAAIRAHDTLHLNVGPTELTLTTAADQYVERKVQLPERWIRALAETQSIAAMLGLRARLDATAWQRFINALPMAGGGAGVSMWLLPAGTTLRQTGRPHAEAIALPGSARLTAVKRLSHLIQAVKIYGPAIDVDTQAAVSAWEFFLPGARLLLMLSPEPYRGFSGEGALLHALSQAETDDALTLGALLAWEAAIEPAVLAQETGFSAERVHHGLQALATAGQVGFDLHEQRYFHRQLPYTQSRLEKNYPRLDAAKALVASGSVRPDSTHHRVRSEDHDQWVSFPDGKPRCTCTFWGKYKGSRGPCKHILAVQLYLESVAGTTSRV